MDQHWWHLVTGSGSSCYGPPCPAHVSTPERACYSGWIQAEGPRAGIGPPGEEPRDRRPFKVSLAPARTSVLTAPSPARPPCSPAGVDGECRRVRCCELLTGMGGFLQAVLFGVTGVQVSAAARQGGRLLPPAPSRRAFPSPKDHTRAGLAFDPMCPVGSLESVHLLLPGGAGLTSPSLRGLVTVEVTAQAGDLGPLSGSRAVASADSASPGRRPPDPIKAAPVCATPTTPSPAGRRVCFPCSAGRIQGQACRPHPGRAATSSWEAFGSVEP